jgi:hypothetical protein
MLSRPLCHQEQLFRKPHTFSTLTNVFFSMIFQAQSTRRQEINKKQKVIQDKFMVQWKGTVQGQEGKMEVNLWRCASCLASSHAQTTWGSIFQQTQRMGRSCLSQRAGAVIQMTAIFPARYKLMGQILNQ